jgi:hypothetical protein
MKLQSNIEAAENAQAKEIPADVDTAPEQWGSQCLVARIQRDEALRAATHTHAGCTASAMGWSIKYVNLHEIALRLVQAKGRYNTQNAFKELRDFISSENAERIRAEKERL